MMSMCSAPYLQLAVVQRQAYPAWHCTCTSRSTGVWTNLGVNIGGEVICKEVVISAQNAADKGLEVVLPAKVPRPDEVNCVQEAPVWLQLDPLLPQLWHLLQ